VHKVIGHILPNCLANHTRALDVEWEFDCRIYDINLAKENRPGCATCGIVTNDRKTGVQEIAPDSAVNASEEKVRCAVKVVRWIVAAALARATPAHSHLTPSFYRCQSNSFLLSINLTRLFDIRPSDTALLLLALLQHGSTSIATRVHNLGYLSVRFWYHVPRDRGDASPLCLREFVFIISPVPLSLASIGPIAPKGLIDSRALMYLRPPRPFQ
jgi:hypothetical protein